MSGSAALSKKSRLGEAFTYVLNQWDALCYYSGDGLAEPDNNAAERAVRSVCLGKKNYLFFGSDHGGERGALLYGLTGTCRLNGIAIQRLTCATSSECCRSTRWRRCCHGTWFYLPERRQHGARCALNYCLTLSNQF